MNPFTGELKGVVYKTRVTGGTEQSLKLDIYYPTVRVYDKSPVIFVFHGGGWYTGSPGEIIADFPRLWDNLLSSGVTVIAVEYGLTSSGSVYPDPVNDCADAINFICGRSADYGINPENVGVFGFSAGGQLALLCALDFAQYAGGENAGYGISYCVSFAGPVLFDEETQNTFTVQIWTMIEALFGGTIESNRNAFEDGSPYNHAADSSRTGFLLIHSEEDTMVPFAQSEAMYEKLFGSGYSAEFIRLRNYTHLLGAASPSASPDPDYNSLIDMISDYIIRKIEKK